ncbi:methyltransferase domain-containing protein [Carboxylicivirga sp. RSCT41]|uniref:methyltransferase domain-containing protein n=1 Tax=Carboxylicivirga agarovorans TaxID=3417570 RepID=UPI003D338A94
MYADQDRGNKEKYQRYLAGMDTIIVEKVASASAYFHEKEGYAIVDVGMASGTSSYILALLFPNTKIIGVDINPKMVEIANKTYSLPNLEFRIDDGETLGTLSSEKISGFFNCSSIHHITSFNNYSQNKAYLTLKRQAELLCEEGVIVIRDFVKPEERDVIIQFPEDQQGLNDAALLEKFALTARSLAPIKEQGFPIKRVEINGNNAYQLNYPDAVEFIRRKDYLNDWNIELQEEYAYYSQKEFETVLTSLGLRTIVSQPIYNAWIINNRYKNKFSLTELNGKPIDCPPTNFVIAAEKVSTKGTVLKAARQLPLMDDNFLKIKSYINTGNNAVFDVAERPGSVIDVLPFTMEGKQVRILAKHAYPRPIIHQNKQLIDGKRYSGYIIEGITSGINGNNDHDTLKQLLVGRLGFTNEIIGEISDELSFYTSPGGVNEMVNSYHIQLKDFINFPKAIGNYSGFNDSGSYRSYNALQLLKSAQVGALPDARLELSIYRLLQRLNRSPEKWLNESCTIQELEQIDSCEFQKIDQVIENLFVPSDKSANFLTHRRTKFYEYPKEGSEQVLEYIEPTQLSSNTIVTLPVYRYNGHIYVGIEKRNLPVPQLIEGNSCLLAAPAFRLPKDIRNQDEMKEYVLNRDFFNTKVVAITKLGEKYLPCIGVCPEQVYPHIVTLNNPTSDLYWIEVEELINNANQIKDGHLLIAIYRLQHMLM